MTTEKEAQRVAFEKHWLKIRGAKKAAYELQRHPLQPQCYRVDSANRHFITWQAAQEQLAERLRVAESALVEIVALQDLQDKANAWHFSGPMSELGDNWKQGYEAVRNDYTKRAPLAWAAARNAIKGEGACTYGPLLKAAINLLAVVDYRHDNAGPPIKHITPYGAVVALREATQALIDAGVTP